MTPPVIVEILSDPKLPSDHEKVVLALPRVKAEDGFWERVGYLRRALLNARRKARLADTMIAQFCIDHKLILVSRDQDYKAIASHSNLEVRF